ncbi:S8 family serine peptidase [Pseudoalteromonas luteoviolacea]|uniref:S8 family serine peptidase n=1 Tax=Pseudoalteromonas luteoviolacea TaxID=43657 RepID=UPI001EEE668D|nr:S8 family peptidase [Pseudoalteromonas luteoviolacea]MCF6439302.1 S8 family serine peptidase [Pseudoalteromonas luteoviolacea]
MNSQLNMISAGLLLVIGQANAQTFNNNVQEYDPSKHVWEYTYQLAGGDPLVIHQWHLQNNGQHAGAITPGVAGIDLNLDFTHRRGILGQGINIAVIDDGLATYHPDLAENIAQGDVLNPDPYIYQYRQRVDDHGTQVAGIAAASAYNGQGGRGVAPAATLTGVNLMGRERNYLTLPLAIRAAMNMDGAVAPMNKHNDARVINQSFGYPFNVASMYGLFPAFFDNINNVTKKAVTESHGGRGAMAVKAAGNIHFSDSRWLDRDNGLLTLIYPNGYALPARDASITDPTNANFWNLTVSALNAKGSLASYSTAGSAVLLTAPAGERGRYSPATVTTTLPKWCTDAAEAHCENPLYSFNMRGTSAAAPALSGAVALIMSANHQLSWRDVRHLMITTATKVDANSEPRMIGDYEAIPSWQTNGAGHAFHYNYGFGLVNVDAAVEKALLTGPILGDLKIKSYDVPVAADAFIYDGDFSGTESIHAQTENLTVEGVRVNLDIAHNRPGDLSIELISPSNTRSVILAAGSDLLNENFISTPILSNHFYGESAKGDWKLRIIDTNAKDAWSERVYDLGTGKFVENSLTVTPQRIGLEQPNNTKPGQLTGWSITFFGH